MPKQERKQTKRATASRSTTKEAPEAPVEDDSASKKKSAAERKIEADKRLAELDTLLDEIDEVLEENAAEFVAAYQQKGGQ